jgi:hypothetical protein
MKISLFQEREVPYPMPKRIETGTPDGEAIGFSDALFSGWLELYNDCRLYLHYVISRYKNEGNTQALIRQWLREGYDIRIVKPSPVMQHIIRKFGFEPAQEYLPDHYEDEVEVWRRPSSLDTVTYTTHPRSRVYSR